MWITEYLYNSYISVQLMRIISKITSYVKGETILFDTSNKSFYIIYEGDRFYLPTFEKKYLTLIESENRVIEYGNHFTVSYSSRSENLVKIVSVDEDGGDDETYILKCDMFKV